jgi:hypothetical protein
MFFKKIPKNLVLRKPTKKQEKRRRKKDKIEIKFSKGTKNENQEYKEKYKTTI